MKTVAALQTGAAISGAIGAGKLAAAGATVAGKAVKATAGKVEKLIERSAAEEALGDAGSGARDKVAEEIDALKRIKENANGPDLTDRSKNAIAYQQSDRMLSDLASQYNDTSVHPRDFKVNIGDKVFFADPNVSIGAPVYMGVTTDEVMLYF